MSREENPPFARGETFYGPSETIDTGNLGGVHLEGKVFTFEDVDPRSTGTGAVSARTGRRVRCRVVRNMSGTTLYGKYLARRGVTAAKVMGYASGLVNTAGMSGDPIDEYLPSAGVRNGDLFYVVEEGPAIVKTPLSAGAENVFAVGNTVCGLTAASSGATTAGRVLAQDLTGATAVLAAQIQGRIGFALSAATTANTNSDLLIDVQRF